jgi:hypothetical protein
MARFRTHGIVIGAKKYPANTVVVDTVGNAQPGDVVYPTLSSTTLNPDWVPLDGAATTMKNASVFAGAVIPCSISGANSVG